MANRWVLIPDENARIGRTAMGHSIKRISDKTVELLSSKQCRTFNNRVLFKGIYRHALVFIR
jgi:hypothetical protein